MSHDTVERLIEEAKNLHKKIVPTIQELDIEKIAANLEGYIKRHDSSSKVAEIAKKETSQHIEKIASFYAKAKKEGYSDQEISEFMEKDAFMGLLPMAGKAVKTVVGAPLKAARTAVFGSKLDPAQQAFKNTQKTMQTAGKKLTEQRLSGYGNRMAASGRTINPEVSKRIEANAMKQVQNPVKKQVTQSNVQSTVKARPSRGAKTLAQRGTPILNKAKSIAGSHPIAVGAGLGVGVGYGASRMTSGQPQVEYGQTYQ